MVDDFGCTPVFRTRSSRVVEFLLELHDIALIDEDGNPLLYECIRRGMITDAIANNDKMKAQFGLRHQGLWQEYTEYKFSSERMKPPLDVHQVFEKDAKS